MGVSNLGSQELGKLFRHYPTGACAWNMCIIKIDGVGDIIGSFYIINYGRGSFVCFFRSVCGFGLISSTSSIGYCGLCWSGPVVVGETDHLMIDRGMLSLIVILLLTVTAVWNCLAYRTNPPPRSMSGFCVDGSLVVPYLLWGARISLTDTSSVLFCLRLSFEVGLLY